ncbi:hypothetical protein HG531_002023 [Fusarium graminearum]|nr:hypothetical protein HG531_002023 [Fusarium graminearum]
MFEGNNFLDVADTSVDIKAGPCSITAALCHGVPAQLLLPPFHDLSNLEEEIATLRRSCLAPRLESLSSSIYCRVGILDVGAAVTVSNLAVYGRNNIGGGFADMVTAVDEERHGVEFGRHDEDDISNLLG